MRAEMTPLESRISEELRLIPRWSIACAVAVFAAAQYYFWVFLPQVRQASSHIPPLLHLYLTTSLGALLALYFLMVGYITQDAPRRGMNVRVWMICVVIPGGIGAVLYFLLRQPLLAECPSCGVRIESEYHYCPHCSYQVSGCCGRCFASTRITDLYCTRCGHDLASDHPPERLQAFVGR